MFAVVTNGMKAFRYFSQKRKEAQINNNFLGHGATFKSGAFLLAPSDGNLVDINSYLIWWRRLGSEIPLFLFVSTLLSLPSPSDGAREVKVEAEKEKLLGKCHN